MSDDADAFDRVVSIVAKLCRRGRNEIEPCNVSCIGRTSSIATSHTKEPQLFVFIEQMVELGLPLARVSIQCHTPPRVLGMHGGVAVELTLAHVVHSYTSQVLSSCFTRSSAAGGRQPLQQGHGPEPGRRASGRQAGRVRQGHRPRRQGSSVYEVRTPSTNPNMSWQTATYLTMFCLHRRSWMRSPPSSSAVCPTQAVPSAPCAFASPPS